MLPPDHPWQTVAQPKFLKRLRNWLPRIGERRTVGHVAILQKAFILLYVSYLIFFGFKISLPIRGSNGLHQPNTLIGWSPILSEFPLPSSQSSIRRNCFHYLCCYPTIRTHVQRCLHFPTLSIQSDSIKGCGKLIRCFVC